MKRHTTRGGIYALFSELKLMPEHLLCVPRKWWMKNLYNRSEMNVCRDIHTSSAGVTIRQSIMQKV